MREKDDIFEHWERTRNIAVEELVLAGPTAAAAALADGAALLALAGRGGYRASKGSHRYPDLS